VPFSLQMPAPAEKRTTQNKTRGFVKHTAFRMQTSCCHPSSPMGPVRISSARKRSRSVGHRCSNCLSSNSHW
jgi:hypothetical protein